MTRAKKPNVTARVALPGSDFEVEAMPERRRGRRWYVIVARRFRTGTLAEVWSHEVLATRDPAESNARLVEVLCVAGALARINAGAS